MLSDTKRDARTELRILDPLVLTSKGALLLVKAEHLSIPLKP